MVDGTLQVALLPVEVKDATGLSVTVKILVMLSVHEPKFATSFMLYDPGALNVCDMFLPRAVTPSLKYHWSDTGVGEELSEKSIFLFAQPPTGEIKSAITAP